MFDQDGLTDVVNDDDLVIASNELLEPAWRFSALRTPVGSIQPAELARSPRGPGSRLQIYFIADTRRTWFNHAVPTKMLDFMERMAPRFDRVVTLANSMGGFGAIAFANAVCHPASPSRCSFPFTRRFWPRRAGPNTSAG